MTIQSILVAAAVLLAPSSISADAATLCTIVADAARGEVLLEEGDCAQRVTPASTFKIPLAVMGFDSGILAHAHAPTLAFEPGDPDWGGDAWRRDTDPAHWMRHSVVWYSQRITARLGRERFGRYVAAFAYGNGDVSGDRGKNNALERSWISSSLTISPREQIGFLTRLLNHRLPASHAAANHAITIVERRDAPGGWRITGKTGGAYPRNADGSFNRDRGWGWYVGWAERGGARVVFARLAQDERRERGSPGIRARDAFLADWPRLAAALGR